MKSGKRGPPHSSKGQGLDELSQSVLRKLNAVPIEQALKTDPVPLPKVTAPSLDDLEVKVPRPKDLTRDDLLIRFEQLRRAAATRRERALREPVASGDDVVLDLLAFAKGKLVPFTARADLQTELAPVPHLPGFHEALVGQKVGASLAIKVTFPEAYPGPEYRNVPVIYQVDIRAAHELKLPAPDDPKFLKSLARGATLDEVMSQLAKELEAELCDELRLDGYNLVLDEVARRTAMEVPKAAVDEEIRRHWGAVEGKMLASKNFTSAEQQEALDGWLTAPSLRAEAERRIRVSAALAAIIERDKLELTPLVAKELIGASLASCGLEVKEMTQALKEGWREVPKVVDQLLRLVAVGYVVKKARIHSGA